MISDDWRTEVETFWGATGWVAFLLYSEWGYYVNDISTVCVCSAHRLTLGGWKYL